MKSVVFDHFKFMNVDKLIELFNKNKNELPNIVLDEIYNKLFEDYFSKFKECCYIIYGYNNKEINNIIIKIRESKKLDFDKIENILNIISNNKMYKYFIFEEWNGILELIKLKHSMLITYIICIFTIKLSNGSINELINTFNNIEI